MSKNRDTIARVKIKLDDKVGAVAVKVMLELDRHIILDTPVKTGRARANWIPSLGAPQHRVTNETDAHTTTLFSAQTVHSNARPYQPLYLTNTLPYIQKLEDGMPGGSKQAPRGMVGRAIRSVGRMFK